MSLTASRQEFWGDLQRDFYVKNTAVYLANQSLESLISSNGRKAHKPVLSHPQVGTYTAHSDISFEEKSAEDQYLEVDTYEYAAEDIDYTESSSTPYDLLSHSLTSIRNGLSNRVEQKFMDQFTSADHTISSGLTEVTSTNILDIIEEAEGVLGAYDAPFETSMRAIVLGPRTVAKLRRARGERETGLGDMVSQNGVVGPWNGWTVVQNNNLPWSATLSIATQPTNGDTVTVAGVTFTFKTTLTSTAGEVLIGANVAAARSNLAAAINDSGTAGTNYVQLSAKDNFILRRKRRVAATSAEAMAFTGYGDIAVSETLTDATDGWSAQEQQSMFMVRGAIDLVIQLMKLEVVEKEKGFAELSKGMIGVGAKAFDDGAALMVRLRQDVSSYI